MSQQHLVLLSVPGLRATDLAHMPRLSALVAGGQQATLTASFPALTCPVQANMTTGGTPADHGVIANGFFWRDRHEVEMWTAWNDCIEQPQIWERLAQYDSSLTSAVWFPLHSKGCQADTVCTPAPIHNPDGSESLWCYTKPTELYGELRDRLGHFPLQHFWGPAASIASTAWIADSAIVAMERFQPNFFYIYLPHLDYASQKHGPDSPEALTALTELDEVLGRIETGFAAGLGETKPLWLVASEYAVVPVDHVVYPNRVLRQAGLLAVQAGDDGEQLDFQSSQAWALADHQLAHVFVRDRDPEVVARVAEIFNHVEGIDEVLVGDGQAKYHLDHPRSGEVILVSSPNSWQAYYWWLDDRQAPGYARTVDIHRKPGYDPVELFYDPATGGIPLDASLVRGSHGTPVRLATQQGVLLSSEPAMFDGEELRDVDVASLVLRRFGIVE